MRARWILAAAFILQAGPIFSTTWDEPWHDQVLREAETLAKYEVLENQGDRIVLKRIGHLAGKETPEKIILDGFYMLRIGSWSSLPTESKVHWDEGLVVYCFLKKAEKGETWGLPTPTAGFAQLDDGRVTATYRHSYHKAVVPEKVYEMTMIALFRKAHGDKVDENPVREFIDSNLRKPPVKAMADPEDPNAKLFFLQHVALECLYLFGAPGDLERVRPFLAFDDLHVQISAVRALSGIDTPMAREELLRFLEGGGEDFAKMMAVWGLKRQDARDAVGRLEKLRATASTEEVGFGGDIMDPRVGTRFPSSVKEAIEKLLEEWTEKADERPQRRTSETMKDMGRHVRLLFDEYMRDPSICVGPDGTYYLTGTTTGQNSIRIWESKDLKEWRPLDFAWTYGGSPWQEKYKAAGRPLWAPEIHYLKGTFWLTYSMPTYTGEFKDSGSGLLRSTTGKPEGPYVDVSPDERLGDEIDASLFQDDDGTVYFVWHCGKIRKMKPDMSGPAEPGRKLTLSVSDPNPRHHSDLCAKIHGVGSFDHIGYEGVFLFKIGDTYLLAGSDHCDGKYTCWMATSKNVYGPYSARYSAIPDGGHNMFFKDRDRKWWSTIFNGPISERPGILPVDIESSGQVSLRAEECR